MLRNKTMACLYTLVLVISATFGAVAPASATVDCVHRKTGGEGSFYGSFDGPVASDYSQFTSACNYIGISNLDEGTRTSALCRAEIHNPNGTIYGYSTAVASSALPAKITCLI